MSTSTTPHGDAMELRVKTYKALIWLTLYGACLHFFDNVYFFDQYPEPTWLNAPIVGLLWIPVALLAHRAVDYVYAGKVDRSYSLVHSYVLGNWISLGHYLFAPPSAILPRINFGIGVQVGLATVLFAYTLWMQFAHARPSLRWTGRTWARNVAMYAVLIAVLEFFWPSRFDPWWMLWRR
jgi:hypothetical protein